MGNKTKIRTKRLYYRRATWQDQKQSSPTLEVLLKNAHEVFKTTAERTFSGTESREIIGANYNYNKHYGVFLHVASYIPDQPTSTILKPSQNATSKIEEEPAPAGKNYLGGDVFLLIHKNDVIICQSGLREGSAVIYISNMLEKSGYTDIAISVGFIKVAKTNKFKLIQKEGVKAIELDASLYQASVNYSERNTRKKEIEIFDIPNLIAHQLSQVFAKDPKLSEISEKENVNIKLSITFDGKEARSHLKDKDFGVIGKKRLEKTSEKIIKGADHEQCGFTIITHGGNRITHDEIVVSDNFKIELFGNSLSRIDVWKKMEDYYLQLEHRGIIKQ
jgi:hypothetical protein